MRVSALTLIVCIGVLSACSSTVTSVRYKPITKPGGRMCSVQCRNLKEACDQTCKLSQRGCVNEMQKQALKDYEIYMRDQLKEHQTPDLRLSDFERYEKCKTEDCDGVCEIKYQDCYANCGGEIEKVTSCKSFCF